MGQKSIREMSRGELERLFAERKAALLEVRDELDRRDRERIGGGRGVAVEFCDYVRED